MPHPLPTQTPTVTLRQATLADRDAWFRMMSDPASLLMAAFTPPNPDDRAAFDARWARILADQCLLVRTILVDGVVAGSVSRYYDAGHAEVTYWIDRAFWGRGIASEALRLFLSEVSERPLYARAATDNAGSRRVLERNGFELVRHERGFADARGEEIEEVVYLRGR
jgi:RimJ/RimL family protein N-acetyltransferase